MTEIVKNVAENIFDESVKKCILMIDALLAN